MSSDRVHSVVLSRMSWPCAHHPANADEIDATFSDAYGLRRDARRLNDLAKSDPGAAYELLNAMNGASIPPRTLLNAAKGFVSGITGKKIRLSTVKAAGAAVKNAVEIMNHYKRFPYSEAGFEKWAEKADALYEKIGKVN